ncbi:hypothetical protein D3C81_2200920 [compost metagenome]
MAQLVQLLLGFLACDLAGRGGGTGPGLRQVLAGNAHHVQRALELGLLAQVHPVLLDITGLVVA